MQIRLATQDDLQLVLDFAEHYPFEVIEAYGSEVDLYILAQTTKKLIALKGIYILEIKGFPMAVMAGAIVPSFFSADKLYNMLFFVVHPNYRRYTARVIDYVEQELVKVGVDKVLLANFAQNNGEKIDRYYRMIGYKVLETTYYKQVKE